MHKHNNNLNYMVSKLNSFKLKHNIINVLDRNNYLIIVTAAMLKP